MSEPFNRFNRQAIHDAIWKHPAGTLSEMGWVKLLKACMHEVERLECKLAEMTVELKNEKDYVILMHDRLSVPTQKMNRMSIELRDAKRKIAELEKEIERCDVGDWIRKCEKRDSYIKVLETAYLISLNYH